MRGPSCVAAYRLQQLLRRGRDGRQDAQRSDANVDERVAQQRQQARQHGAVDHGLSHATAQLARRGTHHSDNDSADHG